MAIIVVPETPPRPEPDITMTASDAAWVLETKTKMGFIPAIKLTRLLTKCGLKTAHDFVTDL